MEREGEGEREKEMEKEQAKRKSLLLHCLVTSKLKNLSSYLMQSTPQIKKKLKQKNLIIV